MGIFTSLGMSLLKAKAADKRRRGMVAKGKRSSIKQHSTLVTWFWILLVLIILFILINRLSVYLNP